MFFSFQSARMFVQIPSPVSLSIIVLLRGPLYRLVLVARTINFPLYHFFPLRCSRMKKLYIGAGNCGAVRERRMRGCVGLIQGRYDSEASEAIPGWMDPWTRTTRQLQTQGEVPRARPSTCNDFVQRWRGESTRSRKFPETFLSLFRFPLVSRSVTQSAARFLARLSSTLFFNKRRRISRALCLSQSALFLVLLLVVLREVEK